MLRTVQELEDKSQLSQHYTMKLRDPERLKALQMRLGISSDDMELIEQVFKDDSDIVPNEWAKHTMVEID
ncbi:hypothetical protein [Staphylococcus shinii]|uniref:hypothetical protein n=1 Tax=Staphylococcus shinii TaxID=2912228 RepID=UPI002978F550|nr:hypothetical protein [Staphylococcus saprophyticus]